jgi:methylase of polypeptide subunit release factors
LISPARAVLARSEDERDVSDKDTALLLLGRALREAGYRFTTPTPATHALVNARPANSTAKSVVDVFGWSRPFREGVLSGQIEALARQAGVVEQVQNEWRSTVRFSTLGELLFVHSAFPTRDAEAVFFGPDTYRFARVLTDAANAPLPKSVRIIDIGSGSGAGGLHLAHCLRRRSDVDLVLSDINTQAMRFSALNAALNDCPATVVHSDVLGGIEGDADLIIANPPYLLDGAKRLYRHGSGHYGEGLSVRIVRESLPRLRSNGRIILYTGTAIVEGVDTFWREVEPHLKGASSFVYDVIDPDVFGDELQQELYGDVDSIAVVALTVHGQK